MAVILAILDTFIHSPVLGLAFLLESCGIPRLSPFTDTGHQGVSPAEPVPVAGPVAPSAYAFASPRANVPGGQKIWLESNLVSNPVVFPNLGESKFIS